MRSGREPPKQMWWQSQRSAISCIFYDTAYLSVCVQVLQAIANKQPFVSRNQHMSGCNEHIHRRVPEMERFVTAVCSRGRKDAVEAVNSSDTPLCSVDTDV